MCKNNNIVLVAGATGMLGSQVVSQLVDDGCSVKRLTRKPYTGTTSVFGDLLRPETLANCCTGVDTVISCAGASMSLAFTRERASFPDVDDLGNRNLLREAQRAGVRKFIYISVHPAGKAIETAYVQAHERFAAALRDSGMPHTIIRPTGFFGFYAKALEQARRGRGIVIGDGRARTNPIHEANVARACIEAIDDGRTEVSIGGPDTFTRAEIVELALKIAGHGGRPTHVPAWTFRGMLPLLRLINPRMHDLFEFGIEVSLNDCAAPVYGTHRLSDYLRDVFATSRTATA